MAVYGYARVSTDKQADEGESLAVQERQLRGWCLMQGKEMDAMFVDRGVSGSTPLLEREQGAALLKQLKAGDTLVAAKLDRLFRSALDALQTIETLGKRKVRVWLLDLGDVTGNGMAKAFMTMAAAFAELERDQIRARVSGMKRDQRERGRYLGGKIPFGFRIREEADANGRTRQVLDHVPTEQNLIAIVREMRAGGSTFRAIQAHLQDEHSRYLGLATIKRIVDEMPAGAPAPA